MHFAFNKIIHKCHSFVKPRKNFIENAFDKPTDLMAVKRRKRREQKKYGTHVHMCSMADKLTTKNGSLFLSFAPFASQFQLKRNDTRRIWIISNQVWKCGKIVFMYFSWLEWLVFTILIPFSVFFFYILPIQYRKLCRIIHEI